MPRKTKEIVVQNDKEIIDEEIKKLAKKSSKTDSVKAEKKATKNTKTSKEKKESISTEKKNSTKKVVKNSEKAESKTTTKATKTSKTTKTTSSTKTAQTKSSTQEKPKTTRKRTKKAETNYIVEYYDLPYRYNQTVVKVLAQTPNSLFVYWDISDSDRENYIQKYGEDFFYTTRPVLKIYNDTLNYNFEIEVDDFANGWYIKVNDADCLY